MTSPLEVRRLHKTTGSLSLNRMRQCHRDPPRAARQTSGARGVLVVLSVALAAVGCGASRTPVTSEAASQLEVASAEVRFPIVKPAYVPQGYVLFHADAQTMGPSPNLVEMWYGKKVRGGYHLYMIVDELSSHLTVDPAKTVELDGRSVQVGRNPRGVVAAVWRAGGVSYEVEGFSLPTSLVERVLLSITPPPPKAR